MEKKNNEVDDAEEECETPLTTSQPVRAERYRYGTYYHSILVIVIGEDCDWGRDQSWQPYIQLWNLLNLNCTRYLFSGLK